jgi:hypothetical protein
MTQQERPAARAKRVSPAPAPPRKRATASRSGPRAIEIGSGVQMQCREVSSDFAIVRFICTRRPTGTS